MPPTPAPQTASASLSLTDTRHPKEILDEKSRQQANADAAASYAKTDFYKTDAGRAQAQTRAAADALNLKR